MAEFLLTTSGEGEFNVEKHQVDFLFKAYRKDHEKMKVYDYLSEFPWWEQFKPLDDKLLCIQRNKTEIEILNLAEVCKDGKFKAGLKIDTGSP